MSKINFYERKKARRIVLQTLYGWTLTQNSLSDIKQYVFKEHENEAFDQEYFQSLLSEIVKNIESLEALFEPFLSRKVQELDLIELNVLRIATFELQRRLDIPYKVVINEALELTKTFGAAESFKFVNGVLDKLARELRKNEM